MKTKKAITYQWAGQLSSVNIPKGTEVVPANNLPEKAENKRYWVQPWEGINSLEEAHIDGYGCLLNQNEVE